MEIHKWRFSTSEQTIENASLLARSPYYQEWRTAVQAVFDAADRFAQTTVSQAASKRLVLLDIPRSLAVSAKDPWVRWQKLGRAIELDTSHLAESGSVLEQLLPSLAHGEQHGRYVGPRCRKALGRSFGLASRHGP
jgi:hypothetical protein